MKDRIHFGTIKQYFMDKFDCPVVDKRFNNSVTGEKYFLICEQNLDIAFFTIKDDGSYLCLDSKGEIINQENIISYVNGNFVKDVYGSASYDEDKIGIRYKGQEISIEEIKQLEEKMYPEQTSIVLNSMFYTYGDIETFHVDEIKYVNGGTFANIFKRKNSDILKEYNKKHYEGKENSLHGILIINKENGDGLLVDTQGFEYARYYSYAPKIKNHVESIIEGQMKETAIYEMKLYVPLEVEKVDEGENEDDAYTVDGRDYYYKIKEKVSRSIDDCGDRGLAKYFWDDDKCRNKVYSIKPDVEIRNDQIMGVAVIKMTKPLNQEEIDSLKDFVTGQFSDGWGEGFEQHEIEVGDGEIYVHFWSYENYYIHTEEEQNEYEKEQNEENVQGMQGINMS